MQTACKIAARDAFARSHQQLQHLISRLQSAESLAMEHCEVEEVLHVDGLELLRRLMQDYLDLREQTERNVLDDGPRSAATGLPEGRGGEQGRAR